ncbi:4-hydroxy-tetrahydrodipicolinate synthase [Lachnospiraceae bacterium KH1T2]|nr:4-hydroxy-tetrahydrodipicolinate synthase [Lachnospiraceae bacterium KH1T2]
MPVFKGAGVAIVTPFKDNGDVNYDKFGEIIEQQIQNGTDAIIVCGTTGEAATLTEDEHLDAIKFCVEKVAKRVPVIAGTGSNCTRTAVYLSQEAQQAGADALLLVTPYYNKTTQAGLVDHFKTVASSVSLPIILYSVKSRTGINIEPETVKTLVREVPNIVGIKEASGDISQVAKIKAICPEVDLYSGNDDQVVPILSLGGLGVISVVSNVAPRYMHDMCYKYFEGNVAEASKMQLNAIDLVEALFCETNPIPVKHAMNLMNMNVGPLRKPLVSMSTAHLERLRNSLKLFGLLG